MNRNQRAWHFPRRWHQHTCTRGENWQQPWNFNFILRAKPGVAWFEKWWVTLARSRRTWCARRTREKNWNCRISSRIRGTKYFSCFRRHFSIYMHIHKKSLITFRKGGQGNYAEREQSRERAGERHKRREERRSDRSRWRRQGEAVARRDCHRRRWDRESQNRATSSAAQRKIYETLLFAPTKQTHFSAYSSSTERTEGKVLLWKWEERETQTKVYFKSAKIIYN